MAEVRGCIVTDMLGTRISSDITVFSETFMLLGYRDSLQLVLIVNHHKMII